MWDSGQRIEADIPLATRPHPGLPSVLRANCSCHRRLFIAVHVIREQGIQMTYPAAACLKALQRLSLRIASFQASASSGILLTLDF